MVCRHVLFCVCWVSIISQSSNSSNYSQSNDYFPMSFWCFWDFGGNGQFFHHRVWTRSFHGKKLLLDSDLQSLENRWNSGSKYLWHGFDWPNDDGWTSRNIQTLSFAQAFYISSGSPGGPNFAKTSFQQGWGAFTMFYLQWPFRWVL